jgi:hypothetical protein
MSLTTVEERYPTTVFIGALMARKIQRQYPRRFKVFWTFLKHVRTLKNQVKEFLIIIAKLSQISFIFKGVTIKSHQV